MYRYFLNPFRSTTDGSAKRALLMGRDHRDKLAQFLLLDATLLAVYAFINEAFSAFEDAYSELHSNEAFYQGNTQLFESTIIELSGTKIKQWDVQIQNVFMNDTPQYTMLLPQNRKPFQKGAYELRIDALASLSKSLVRFPELSTIKDDVDVFLKKIYDIRSNQQKVEAVDSLLRQNVETTRIELAFQMHRAFGYLLYMHYKNPSEISRYYEMKYLQTPTATTNAVVKYDVYSINADSQLSVYNGELSLRSFISFKNTGITALKIFTSATPTSPTPADATLIAPSKTYSFYANEESTDQIGYKYLIVVNETDSKGKFEVHKEEVAENAE